MKALVCYIHSNPLRTRLADDMKALDRWAFSGHAALMGPRNQLWQETLYVANGYELSLDASLINE